MDLQVSMGLQTKEELITNQNITESFGSTSNVQMKVDIETFINVLQNQDSVNLLTTED